MTQINPETDFTTQLSSDSDMSDDFSEYTNILELSTSDNSPEFNNEVTIESEQFASETIESEAKKCLIPANLQPDLQIICKKLHKSFEVYNAALMVRDLSTFSPDKMGFEWASRFNSDQFVRERLHYLKRFPDFEKLTARDQCIAVREAFGKATTLDLLMRSDESGRFREIEDVSGVRVKVDVACLVLYGPVVWDKWCQLVAAFGDLVRGEVVLLTILQGIVLFSPRRKLLENRDVVKAVQTDYFNLLFRYLVAKNSATAEQSFFRCKKLVTEAGHFQKKFVQRLKAPDPVKDLIIKDYSQLFHLLYGLNRFAKKQITNTTM